MSSEKQWGHHKNWWHQRKEMRKGNSPHSFLCINASWRGGGGGGRHQQKKFTGVASIVSILIRNVCRYKTKEMYQKCSKKDPHMLFNIPCWEKAVEKEIYVLHCVPDQDMTVERNENVSEIVPNRHRTQESNEKAV